MKAPAYNFGLPTAAGDIEYIKRMNKLIKISNR